MSSSNFKGMVGKALVTQGIKRAVNLNAQAKAKENSDRLAGKGGHSGKYLFVANANCCPKCAKLGQTPHFFNVPDVAFITHPNCKCATIEAPDGLSPAELMEWAKNPIGVMRYGWNYGVSFAPVKITERNRFNQFLKFNNRVRPTEGQPRTRRKVRATASEEQIAKVRRAVKRGTLKQADDLTESIKKLIEAERVRKHNDRVRNNASGLRKGNTWNPNGNKMKRKMKTVISDNPSLNLINAAFGGNAVVIPRKKRAVSTRTIPSAFPSKIIGSSSLAQKKYNEEKKRQKRLKALMNKLGM